MQHTTVAIDLAKSVFQVAVSRRPGRVSQRKRLSRPGFERFIAQLEPAHVVMEACGSSHYWGRVLQAQGHTVRLLPPHRVRPYRAGNKTDDTDTKALLQAFRNPAICPVPVKSVDQQALVSLHRLRMASMTTRIARINLLRGTLREFGITIPVGPRHVLPQVETLSHDPEATLPPPIRTVLNAGVEEIRMLEARIKQIQRELEALGSQIPAVRYVDSVPGIGLLTATALVAFLGDVHRFPSGRRLASFLGLTPKEHSSGQRRRLGSISKHGDTYLRTLLIHGARAVLVAARKASKSNRPLSPLHVWALEIQRRRGHNTASVALANKLARFVWAVWKEEREFQLVRA